MHFYKTEQGDIVCAPCTGRTGLPLGPDEAGPDDELTYVGVTGVPEGIFRCTSCEERFIVYDGLVFMEVT